MSPFPGPLLPTLLREAEGRTSRGCGANKSQLTKAAPCCKSRQRLLRGAQPGHRVGDTFGGPDVGHPPYPPEGKARAWEQEDGEVGPSWKSPHSPASLAEPGPELAKPRPWYAEGICPGNRGPGARSCFRGNFGPYERLLTAGPPSQTGPQDPSLGFQQPLAWPPSTSG